MRILFYIFLMLLFFSSPNLKSQEDHSYPILANKIINSTNAEDKLKWSAALSKSIINELKNEESIKSLDSTALLKELISHDNNFQIVTWAIEFNGKWEYYGILKSYNEVKKKYQIFDLIALDFLQSFENKGIFDEEEWPAGIYTKLIENEYNKRKYYTFLGWIAPTDQTAHKFIEVMTLSKSGKPYFGKTNFFKEGKEYKKRILYSYNRQSHFILDYGEYEYNVKEWNRKKKRYDIKNFSAELIVFDHLISRNPNMPEMAEFFVPVGNSIDAYKFENGKWVFIGDIDARNLKRKTEEREAPKLDLFEQSDTDKSN